MAPADTVLVIACGAIAHELVAVIRANDWQHCKVQCLPAVLHNYPQRIPAAVRAKIHSARRRYRRVFVAYADCGTGGLLDEVLEEEGVQRLPGAHCYEFFAGTQTFRALSHEEPGTFYLTDFLARHFERVIVKTFRLDEHPELLEMLFGNYRRVVYLAQTESPELTALARAAAQTLRLQFERRFTGYGELTAQLVSFAKQSASTEQVTQWQN
ncbi:MAG: DUF1638 domain-containing protein [Gammaproteobacteria bacterium]|nr:DUF1638 domain-containing protein [Gammaproteobacteria bacterium]